MRSRLTKAALLALAVASASRLIIAAPALATYQLSPGWATFGLSLPQGTAPDGVQVGSLPTQVDVKTRWPDGSMRFGIVSAQVASKSAYAINAARPQTGTFEAKWPAAETRFVIDGETWVAPLPPAGSDLWLSGPLVRETRVWSTPTLNGTAHPFLRVIYDVRSFRSGGNRIDIAVENTLNVPATNKVVYDTTIVVNGAPVFSYKNAEHGSFSRWRKVFAADGLKESTVVPDFSPFQQAQVIPTWISGVVDRDYATSSPNFDILQIGRLTFPIGTTGGRPEIGPYPAWAAQYTVHRSSSQREFLLRHGDLAAGAWSVHYREANGSLVTLDKKPLFWSNRPGCGCDGSNGPANNRVGMRYPIEAGAAHHGSLAYIPYLITGDRYFLEEVQFWANVGVFSWEWQRNDGEGLIASQNIRAVGWGLRNLVDAAVATPDGDPLKTYFTKLVNANLVAIDARAKSRSDPDGLGAVYIGDQVAGKLPIWQTAYLSWAITHAQRNGFRAGGLWARDKMSQFQLALFTHEKEYDREYAAPYFPFVLKPVEPRGFTSFESFGEMWRYNFDCKPNCGKPTLFAGGYGPEARLHLMIGIVNGWPGAQPAYDWLMGWSARSRGGMWADIRSRSQYGLDISSVIIGGPSTAGSPARSRTE